MKHKIFALGTALILLTIMSSCSKSEKQLRTITVTGSSEMFVSPDMATLEISITEYYEEEFEKYNKNTEYKNKVHIDTIENILIKNLHEIGIKDEDISLDNVGNYYKFTGQEFKIRKTLIVKIHDFNKINKIASTIGRKGISSMRIIKTSNKDIQKYRAEVKQDAVIAAKDKSDYLLSVLGEKTGKIISIKEINSSGNLWYTNTSNSISNSYLEAPESVSELSNIKLRYEIEIAFEIK
jgi:uncharacterized protein YggE